jgi:hypothetical protein
MLLGAACASCWLAGCMFPVYKVPTGYSSTYHRALQDFEQIRLGRWSTVEVPPGGGPEALRLHSVPPADWDQTPQGKLEQQQ